MKHIIAGIIILVIMTGCAVLAAQTLSQRAYALELDYVAIQAAADTYVNRPDADPWAKISVKEANRRSVVALDILGDVAEGSSLSFCSGNQVTILPPNTDAVLAKEACANNLEGVLAKAGIIIGGMRALMRELEKPR